MKKIFALIITLMLLCSVFNGVIVSAEDKPIIAVGNAAAKAGDSVKIMVSVNNNPGIMSMQLKVGYDNNALKLIGATESSFKGLTYGPTYKNPFISTWMDALITENDTTNGTFVTLEFLVLDTAPNGKSQITVFYEEDAIFDIDFNNVAFATQNGYVDITNPNSSEQQNASSQPDTSLAPTDSSNSTSSEVTSDTSSKKENESNASENSGKTETTNSDNHKDTTTNKSDNTDNDQQNGWIIWVVIALIVILGGSFVAFIIISKKK